MMFPQPKLLFLGNLVSKVPEGVIGDDDLLDEMPQNGNAGGFLVG